MIFSHLFAGQIKSWPTDSFRKVEPQATAFCHRNKNRNPSTGRDAIRIKETCHKVFTITQGNLKIKKTQNRSMERKAFTKKLKQCSNYSLCPVKTWNPGLKHNALQMCHSVTYSKKARLQAQCLASTRSSKVV